jgi:4'-phosphopantetheinyl transferase
MTLDRPPEPSWVSPTAHPDLPVGEVQVWRGSLDRPEVVVGRLERLLSADERTRADRFYAARDRERFIVGRGMLRTILGRYLGTEPERLVFHYGGRGKPSLGEGAGSSIEFNLAHSQGLALLAVARGRRVGIDVEQVRALADADGIVDRFFSRREAEAYRALPAGGRPEAFFRCWTRKEAYIKAIGEGFSLPLERFAVTLGPEEPPQLIDVEGRPGEAGRWSLRDLAAGPGFAAAIAVEGSGWELRGFRADHS